MIAELKILTRRKSETRVILQNRFSAALAMHPNSNDLLIPLNLSSTEGGVHTLSLDKNFYYLQNCNFICMCWLHLLSTTVSHGKNLVLPFFSTSSQSIKFKLNWEYPLTNYVDFWRHKFHLNNVRTSSIISFRQALPLVQVSFNFTPYIKIDTWKYIPCMYKELYVPRV